MREQVRDCTVVLRIIVVCITSNKRKLSEQSQVNFLESFRSRCDLKLDKEPAQNLVYIRSRLIGYGSTVVGLSFGHGAAACCVAVRSVQTSFFDHQGPVDYPKYQLCSCI